MKYHCAMRTKAGNVVSVLVVNKPLTERGVPVDEYRPNTLAEFCVCGPISEEIASKLATQFRDALELAHENTNQLFANTFLATRHPK